ncbi:hypothetical protein MKW92_039885 [Papaver armeniacum]|nr:hypothetical protein MKW92_039885 [Papaver armeniacum]
MERSDNRDADHIVEIEMRHDVSSPGPDCHHDEEGASSSRGLATSQSPLASSNGHGSRNLFNKGFMWIFNSVIWTFVELICTMSQIVASAIVLALSRLKDPQLFVWALIYASGCLATLPFLYRRFMHRNQGTARVPVSRAFIFAWLTVGNMWLFIFGKHMTFGVKAPFLHSMMFLKFCMLLYPCIYIVNCFCVLYVISSQGFHEDLNRTRGSATETTNVHDTNTQGVGEGGGTLAAGTEKALIILWKDAVCSICLGKYADNKELKGLPCAHFFHVDCVDKWLKNNDSCPLCKRGIGESSGTQN